MHRTLLALLMSLGGQAQARLPVHDSQQPFLVSVNVDLVVLNATVSDRKGHFVSDLREQDFEVYEDGVRQSIQLFRHEDIPVTVGLVVDHSGSMRHKLADVVAAARTFVQFSSPEDEMFVVNFNEHVTMGLPPAVQVTNRSNELAGAISHSPAIGMTALYDAVIRAREQLRAGTRDKKVLIVISDGGDNASTRKLGEVLRMAERSSAQIYTIGIFEEDDPDRNPEVLKRLAQATGGEAFFPRELKEVVAICERIARDIRHQYALGYVPSRPAQPGGFRTIKVVARAAGQGRLFVRTRAGYIAGGESVPANGEDAK
jgi:Ca-activated chloride channel family protein